jgi:hypothetical protein
MRTNSASLVAAVAAAGVLALALSTCGSPGAEDVSAAAGTAPSVSPSVSTSAALTASASASAEAAKTGELLEVAGAGDLVKVRRLLADGAKPDIGVAQTLVFADADDPSLITAMVGAGLDVDLADELSPEHTILMWTGEIGHPKMAKALLDAGADIDALDTYGDPAVSVAAFNGHLDVVKLLVARGAALDKRGLGGNTAVGHAKRAGYPKIAAYLVSKGAPE